MSLKNLWDDKILTESTLHPDTLFLIILLNMCLIRSFTFFSSNFTHFNICLFLKRRILCSTLFKSCQFMILITIIVCFYHINYLTTTGKLIIG